MTKTNLETARRSVPPAPLVSLLFLLLLAGCGGGGPAATDGGSDSASDGAPDAVVDAEALCVSDADCSDGLFCNGVELCDPTADDADAAGCLPVPTPPCMADQTCSEEADACETVCDINPDADGDGAQALACGGLDCDDSDAQSYPGNTEVCDDMNRDEDCDPTTLGGRDLDGDGFQSVACCNPRADGVLACGQDCNDVSRGASPDDGEVCDGVDNDCDGLIDEGVLVAGFVDADRDLHGDGTMPFLACPGTAGHSTVADDCDDTEASVHGAQPELCNSRDDDCDGTVDEDAAPVLWFRDLDGDGFGSAVSGTNSSCEALDGFSLFGSDCDDSDSLVNPAAAERCNALDDDCNGRADFMVAEGDFEDDDSDGAADAACAPDGVIGDCDDADPRLSPLLREVVDGLDNDCDGAVDDRCVVTNWYLDDDGDGFGDSEDAVRSCDPIEGRVLLGGDADDSSPDVSPSVREICNGVDDDGDGAVDEQTDALCVFDHAIGTCVSGTCELGLCERGFTDCNGASSDGCEVSTRTDALNCGFCDTVCTDGIRSRPICIAGSCDLECDLGFADCDGLTSSGCETDLEVDPTHCGSCERLCDTRPGSSSVCTASACGISCNAGFTNCDGMVGTGCEVETGRDTANCGSCGRSCPLASDLCVSGACIVPPYPIDGAVDLMPTADVELTSGAHSFRRIVIPIGVTVTTVGSGVLELHASQEVTIDGTIDVSGSRGGRGTEQRSVGGGATGNPNTPGADEPSPSLILCNPSGRGGFGPAGQRSPGSTGDCGDGGRFGGGAIGNGFGGGGGGGAGGGGGGGRAATRIGGDGGGPSGGAGGLFSSGGSGGVAPGAYAGGDGDDHTFGAGGGGSIGAAAAADLRAVTTFVPGSGGGAAGSDPRDSGGGGGGGGGALRITSPTRITIHGTLLANGGAGGGTQGQGGAGGGGSGGVIYLSSPSLLIDGTATVEATGGPGGTGLGPRFGGDGGLGRIRVSVVLSECAIFGAMTPATTCASADTAERGHVGAFPN